MKQAQKQVVLDLPPVPGYPRNSEGAFLTRKDGSILFVYSRYRGDDAADDATADLAKIISRNGGLTWSKPEVLLRAGEQGVKNLMSVSLLRMADGDIGLFYILRRGWHDARLHLRRSADEGETWGEERCCITWPGYHVTNNDRVIRLAGGRILVPTAYHKLRANPGEPDCYINGIGTAHFFYSDDDGSSWREAEHCVPLPSAHSRSGLQEPGVVELADGVLWCYARTDLGRQYEFFSRDKGLHWTPPEPSAFTAPCSPLSVKRAPDGRLLAVWNPIPNYQTRAQHPMGWGRTPLVMAFSRDEGITWSDPELLEDAPDHGYCYAAIHFTGDNAALLAYCAGGGDHITLASLRILRVELR